MAESKAPLRTIKRVQFGILSPDEIVSCKYNFLDIGLMAIDDDYNVNYRECSS